jgi:hypothetical protein
MKTILELQVLVHKTFIFVTLSLSIRSHNRTQYMRPIINENKINKLK